MPSSRRGRKPVWKTLHGTCFGQRGTYVRMPSGAPLGCTGTTGGERTEAGITKPFDRQQYGPVHTEGASRPRPDFGAEGGADAARPWRSMGVDTEGGVVGPLRLWQREEGDIKIGGAYVVRGLKVVNDRAWDSTRGMWIRSADAPIIIECSPRTACEDVEGVESITQCF